MMSRSLWVTGADNFTPSREGMAPVVPYEGLFSFVLVLIGVAELVLQFRGKKK